MSTLQRARPVSAVSARRPFLRELTSFGLVGTVGTVITVVGANVLRGFWESPLATTLVPTMLGTLWSYLAHRYWTFRHRDSSGSGREVAVFFGLNGIGMVIQMLCSGFTFYTLGHRDALSYNAALLAGLALASAFRYWSYKKWVFTPAAL